MKPIQVLLDEKLLKATDQAASHANLDRSELIRVALRKHLRRLEVQVLEDRDRLGYEKTPQDDTEISDWESVLAWPED